MKIEYVGRKTKSCKGCGEMFSRLVIVDGVKRDFSGRVNCFLCSPLGSNNSYHLEKHKVIDSIHHKLCARCKQFKPIESDFYVPTAGNCKLCANIISAYKKRTLRAMIVAYKGGKCQDCEGVFPAPIYDFHHRDPHIKEFNVSRYIKWEKLRPELDKCDLLCPTCHRLRHFNAANQHHL